MLLKLLKGVFHTKGLEKESSDYERSTPEEREIWKRIFEALDGESGYVVPNYSGEGYVFAGFDNDEKEKEFCWQVEQNPFSGQYINQRTEFDLDWDDEVYSMDGCLVIPEKNFEVVEKII